MTAQTSAKIRSYSLYILITILAIFQIVISNRLASFGREISEISTKTNEILDENERIKKNIASSSAILTLGKKAEDLGFTQKAQLFYIDEQYPVALKPF